MWIFIILLVGILILFELAIYRAPLWLWAIAFLGTTALLSEIQNAAEVQSSFLGVLTVGMGLLAVLFTTLSIPSVRRLFLVRPVFRKARKFLSPLSNIEKEALKAGTPGFEAGFFSGRPDWEMLRKFPNINLTAEEKRFLDGPAEELCQMINDWEIRDAQKIPKKLWDFAKKNGFLGLRASKEYGGLAFSFQAQSIILGKIASRSLDASTIVEVPNSLGPDELLKKYGTEEQKNTYLPRLAQGKDIPAFAITSPMGGTDAAAMRDVGYVEEGKYEGKKVLGIRLTWDKRYITFAPDATLIVLAFQLFDPANLLEKGEKIGITLALIPAHHRGVEIGARHLVGGAAFSNGPIWGKDVFIPLEWVIGAESGAGKGWKMIMECLFVGRAVSLPSMSVASVKAMLRYSSAYARVRRQFGKPIGTIEGIEEPLARLAEMAYVCEAARALTAAMVDSGQRPGGVAGLMKYQTTEAARRAVNDAMDIHGGRAICDGPSNYLQSTYQMAPVGITVEGANIVTRSLITFAQGVLGSHPYLFDEVRSLEMDERTGLPAFEHAFFGHVTLLISNTLRSFCHSLTGGMFGSAPRGVPAEVGAWYRRVWRYSASFALVADVTALFFSSRLKKKQKIGGRLADALSELFFLSAVLRHYEDDGFPEGDLPIVRLSLTNGLYRFEQALAGILTNFPSWFARFFLRLSVFPLGTARMPARDNLGHEVSALVLKPGEVRERLTRNIYISKDMNDAAGVLEQAFVKVVEAESALKKLEAAVRSRLIKRHHHTDWIAEAEQKGVLTKDEAALVGEAEALAHKAISVDHFPLA